MWKLTLTVQVAQLLYHQLTTNFDFYPFNNIRKYSRCQRLLESSVNGFMMLLPIGATLLNTKASVVGAFIVLGGLLIGEYLSWWHPYFFGAGGEWQATHTAIFQPTRTVLSPIKNHPVPNLEHCLLHSLTLLCLGLTIIYYPTHF